jgi:UDP-N-acetylmuramoyl-tripeptide--D-alanyl-D-alanine ligase
MAELGKDSMKEHQYILNIIRNHQWENVLLVGEDFSKIPHPFIQFTSADEAAKWLKQKNIKNSFLLIKGSRTTQMEKVLDSLEE